LPRFENKEFAFEVPEGWEDRSIISFEAPRPPGSAVGPNVTLSHVALPPGQTLATFASQQVANLAGSLPKFEFVEQRPATVAGQPAVQLLYHWKHPEGGLTQRITLFSKGEKTYTFTMTALRGDMDRQAEIFEKILASLTVQQPLAAPAFTPGSMPPRVR
jgi:hypothetical protein